MVLNKKNLLWLILSLLIIILDQLSKHWMITNLTYGEPWVILPMFNLTLTNNPGAAFNFLSSADGWQRWLFTAIAIFVSIYILFWLMYAAKRDYLTKIGLSLVLGGAIGNLCDRLHYGFVIDFIQVHYKNWYFPDFNLADSAITVGAIFIIVTLLFNRGKQ